jgi:chromosome segregation ATPase
LRSQIDELLKENESSVAEHDALSKEIDELKSKNSELQGLEARLSELSKVEENYKESLHSVKSTSRALQVSQNELAKQKEIVNKLQQDIDELQIFSVRKSSRNATPLVNDFKNQEGDDSQNSQKEDIEDFENEHYNLKVRDLQAELFITKQDNEDLKREILTLKKKLLVVNTPNSSL